MPDLPLFNVAILGTGRIADRHLAPAIVRARGMRLWRVLSRDTQRAATFAERHGAAAPEPGVDRLETLLDDPELDAVVVATPDKLHAPQALAAVRAGKHVLVEKPMATSINDARRLVRAADHLGVTLGVAYHLRWHAGHRTMVDLVRSGRLGRLRHVRVQWSTKAPDASNWRAHPLVGQWWSLAAVGTHCLDLIRWIMVPECGDITVVRSVVGRSVWRGPHDETAAVVLEFESGATAAFCSSVLFAGPSRVEVYGSEGYAVGTDTLGPRGDGELVTHDGPLPFEPVNPFVGELEDFAVAATEGRSPAVDGREGTRNVELLFEIIEQG